MGCGKLGLSVRELSVGVSGESEASMRGVGQRCGGMATLLLDNLIARI